MATGRLSQEVTVRWVREGGRLPVDWLSTNHFKCSRRREGGRWSSDSSEESSITCKLSNERGKLRRGSVKLMGMTGFLRLGGRREEKGCM